MKFRFCGGQDAPDWILGEVSVLSKMSSVRMTLLARQLVKQLLGLGIDYEKIEKLTTSKRFKFEPSDIKAMIAALKFVVSNSAKYDVQDETLHEELQQLGLPKDISTSIKRCYAANKVALREHLVKTNVALPTLVETEWRVDYILGTSQAPTSSTSSVRLKLHTRDTQTGNSGNTQTIAFDVSVDKMRVLHSELKAARALMDTLHL